MSIKTLITIGAWSVQINDTPIVGVFGGVKGKCWGKHGCPALSDVKNTGMLCWMATDALGWWSGYCGAG